MIFVYNCKYIPISFYKTRFSEILENLVTAVQYAKLTSLIKTMFKNISIGKLIPNNETMALHWMDL
jgi:hypothetical protein